MKILIDWLKKIDVLKCVNEQTVVDLFLERTKFLPCEIIKVKLLTCSFKSFDSNHFTYILSEEQPISEIVTIKKDTIECLSIRVKCSLADYRKVDIVLHFQREKSGDYKINSLILYSVWLSKIQYEFSNDFDEDSAFKNYLEAVSKINNNVYRKS